MVKTQNKPFINMLPGDFRGAVSVPMARVGGCSARTGAGFPAARWSARFAKPGGPCSVILGLTITLAVGSHYFEGLRAGSQRTLRRGGNERMTITSAQGRGLAIEISLRSKLRSS